MDRFVELKIQQADARRDLQESVRKYEGKGGTREV
jgi:hypothetical protein